MCFFHDVNVERKNHEKYLVIAVLWCLKNKLESDIVIMDAS